VAKRSRQQNRGTRSAGSTRSGTETTTQTERISRRREERSRGRQAAAQARRRQKRIQRIALVAVALIIVAAGAYFAYQRITHEEPGTYVADLGGGQHVPEGTTVTTYNSDPPTSGQHWGSVASWGVHTEPIPNELQVHNLEHGGIIMQYSCEDCPEIVAELEAIANQCPVKLITAPRPGMEHTIAVTAWNRILTMDELDREKIQSFIDAYADEGPERLPSESQAWDRCN
jgi:hypothetical protein